MRVWEPAAQRKTLNSTCLKDPVFLPYILDFIAVALTLSCKVCSDWRGMDPLLIWTKGVCPEEGISVGWCTPASHACVPVLTPDADYQAVGDHTRQ